MSLVLNVEILGEFKKLTDATNGATKQLSGLQKTSQNISKKITGAFAAIGVGLSFNAIVNGIKDVTRAASDLNEAQNAVNVAFGDSAKELEDFSKTAAQQLGLSRKELLGISTQFSSFAKTIGGEGEGAIKVIKDLSTRGADFASVFNLEVSDALEKFQSGLAGQSEPLRKFGIDLSAATVEQYALANGIFDGTGQMTEQQKILARYGALMEQTRMVTGDFANTSDGLANTQRILKAELENIRAEVGTALLPVMVELFQEIRNNLPGIKTFISELAKLVPIFVDLILKAVEYKDITIGLSIAFGVLTAALKVATLATTVFTGAITGPVVAGIIAGIAAITVAYNVLGSSIQEVINKQNQFKSGIPGGDNAAGTVPLGPGSPISAAGGKVGIIGKVASPTTPKLPVQTPAKPGQTTINVNINRAQVNANDVAQALNDKLKSQGSSLRIQ